MRVIPFISQLAAHEQERWCEALNMRLKAFRVVLPKTMSHEQIAQCECAVVANPLVNELSQYPSLKWVHSLWAGVDSLVNQLEHPKFKIVRLVDPMLATTMAEAVLTWCLYLHRHIPLYREQQRQALWQQHESSPVSQHRVAILGLGELGKASAVLLNKVGVNVLGWSRTAKQIDGIQCFFGDEGLQQVLSASDTVVVLLPLTQATYHLIDQTTLSQMKKGAALINFARGAVVSTADLLQALNDEQLSHAVLDVFEQEPLPSQSTLWHHPKITVTPHVSAPTNRATACDIVAGNLERYFQTGQIPEAVSFKQGY
ncbi:2-hydroxyacid dehydrogenase [Thalassotalea fusca]